ncbi:MAG: hypothetical protein JO181_16910 [Solirubrobacterales bacterium]|nr:hypothetical protein [Solirubrobacterales bacterium]
MRSLAGRTIAVALAFCVAGGIPAGSPAIASAGTFEVDACGPYTTTSGVFQHAAVFGIGTYVDCSATGVGLQVSAGPNTVPAGTAARWYTETPAGLTLVAVTIPTVYSYYLNFGGSPWGGGFWWPGGGYNTREGVYGWGTFLPSVSFFEFQVVCGSSTCDGAAYRATLTVSSIHLFVQETSVPSIVPTSPLYGETGWIRGNGWPVSFQTDDPSGVCHVQATVGSTVFQGDTTLDPNHTVWHQCSVTSFNQTINTTDYPDGPLTIGLEAYNAAGNWATPWSTVHVDNSPVGLSLSGPTDVPSTAGTQYLTASATAGPSGVSGIGCTLDGAPYQWYPGSTVQIPVSGLGVHQLTCYGANNAKDPSGNVATSQPQTWTLRIGEPTVMGIAFTRIADALRCRKVPERVTVPARWVTVRRRHKLVKVREPAHVKTVKVIRCHPRTTRKKVTVWRTVTHNGKPVRVKHTEWVRVVVPPHLVASTTRRLRHGQGATVDGWLGTANGTALAGQPVTVYSAPDNGQNEFVPVASAITGADGGWSASIGAGPSRLVEAVYGGSPILEPSMSGSVRLIVPARVELISASPRRVAWGGTVRIVGRLDGGYLPPGGALVRLRIGTGSAYTTYGVQEHVGGNGRFTTTYTFGAGLPSVYQSFWFQLASLPMGSYPYAPASSGRRYVLVGGHPAPTRRRR